MTSAWRIVMAMAVVGAVFVSTVTVSTSAAESASGPHGATVGDDAGSSPDPANSRDTRGQVQAVVRALVAIGAVTAVLLIGFVWHTSPRRRYQVARRRADERAEATMAAADAISEREWISAGRARAEAPEGDH